MNNKDTVTLEQKLNSDTQPTDAVFAPLFAKPLVVCRYFFKALKLKFWFRFFAILDVLFAPKFELTTYRKDGSHSAITKFDKAEIENAGRCGLL